MAQLSLHAQRQRIGFEGKLCYKGETIHKMVTSQFATPLLHSMYAFAVVENVLGICGA